MKSINSGVLSVLLFFDIPAADDDVVSDAFSHDAKVINKKNQCLRNSFSTNVIR